MSYTPKSNQQKTPESNSWAGLYFAFSGLIVVLVTGLMYIIFLQFWPQSKEKKSDLPYPIRITSGPIVQNGIDLETGLIAEGSYLVVKQQCTSCHSAKLITQNRMDRATWITTIRWMQETQGLGDLYENETKILDYFEKYYPPVKKGRRQNLKNIEWYELN